MRRRTISRAASAGLALALLGACQGAWPLGIGSWQVAPTVSSAGYHESLAVSVGVGRSLMAVTAEIAREVVSVQDGAGVTTMQTLQAASLTAGQGVATFAALAPGPAAVKVEAFGADDRLLGSADQTTWIAAGVTNHAALTFYLTPTAAPSPGPGSLAATVVIQDGATAAVAPPAVPRIHLTFTNIAYTSFEDGQMLVDHSGAVWVSDRRILPDGSMQTLHGDHPLTTKVLPDGTTQSVNGDAATALAETTNAQVWAYRSHRLDRLTAQGEIVATVPAPGDVPRDGLKVDHDDNLWVSSGNQVYKLGPDGTTLGTFAVPGPAGPLAIDNTAGVVWVSLGAAGRVCRLSLQGTLLHTTTVDQSGDTLADLALDTHGCAWVAETAAGRAVKLRTDGTIAGIYPAVTGATALVVDARDNVLVAPSADLGIGNMVLLSPEGRLLATYDFGPSTGLQVWDLAYDAAGALWMLHGVGSGSLARIAL